MPLERRIAVLGDVAAGMFHVSQEARSLALDCLYVFVMFRRRRRRLGFNLGYCA
jgi:hypothetical protein